MPIRTVAYIRVSTEKQAVGGVSLEAQQAKVELYAQLQDLELVDVIVDAGVSAKTTDRPGLSKALHMLKGGQADALLVVKLDRLTRSVKDLGSLLEEYFSPGKAALMSVSEQIDTRSAAGRLVLNVLGSVSQWEREAAAERTTQVMQHMKDQGEYTGGRPRYGYRLAADGVKVEMDPAEQAAIFEARRLKGTGLTLREIARTLRQRGHSARNGEVFLPMQVARMLKDA